MSRKSYTGSTVYWYEFGVFFPNSIFALMPLPHCQSNIIIYMYHSIFGLLIKIISHTSMSVQYGHGTERTQINYDFLPTSFLFYPLSSTTKEHITLIRFYPQWLTTI